MNIFLLQTTKSDLLNILLCVELCHILSKVCLSHIEELQWLAGIAPPEEVFVHEWVEPNRPTTRHIPYLVIYNEWQRRLVGKTYTGHKF